MPYFARITYFKRLPIEVTITALETFMKKGFVVITGLILLTAAPLLVRAQGHGHGSSSSKVPKSERVFCCHDKNNCDNIHSKAECEKEGGKVVKSCKECK